MSIGLVDDGGLLQVRLFGKYSAQRHGRVVPALQVRKVQELLALLLIRGDHELSREMLSGVLWPDAAADNARAYLRKALWQLQTVLDPPAKNKRDKFLLVERDWLRLNPSATLWCDVAVFQHAYQTVRGLEAHQLDRSTAHLARQGIDVYRGDLLDGWYQDWCLFERERFQVNYLAVLDKLLAFAELERNFDQALADGARILQFDRTREQTHRQLMRLHALRGDRAAAVRQFETCVGALKEELDVGPSPATVELLRQIKEEQHVTVLNTATRSLDWLPEVLQRLYSLRLRLSDLQLGLQQDLEAVENTLKTLN